MYYLKTLGGLTLLREGHQGREESALANSKSLLLLAWLALRSDRSDRRDHLAEFFWPGTDHARARRALRQALFYLSRHAPDVLEREDDTVSLNPNALNVDLWEFQRCIEEEHHAAAIALYHGPFAAGIERKIGVEVEHWVESENARIAPALSMAYPREVVRLLQEGDAAGAVCIANSWVGYNPLNDEAQYLLIRTLAQTGDEVGALSAFESYRALSEDESDEFIPDDVLATVETIRARRTGVAVSVPPPEDTVVRVGSAPAVAQRRIRISIPLDVVRNRKVILGAGVTAALVLILAAAALASVFRRAPPPPLSGIEARVLGTVQQGGQSITAELVVSGGGIQVRQQSQIEVTSVPSPDARVVAFREQAPDGWNVAIRQGRTLLTLTTDPGDEYPIAWSPDGRFLAYAHRRLLADGRRQAHTIDIYDLTAGERRRLTTLTAEELPSARWSPDGTRIAFTADVRGSPDVFVTGFDGSHVRGVSSHPSSDGQPSWSPDGEHLVFVSRRSGASDLYLVRPDGADLRQLTFTGEPERSPVWISPSVIVYLVGERERTQLWTLDVFAGVSQRLAGETDLTSLTFVRDPPAVWIERVRIVPRVRVVTPGQHIPFTLDFTGPNDELLPGTHRPVRWISLHPEIARFHESTVLEILRTGSTQIVVTAAGWRSDTLSILSLPLLENTIEPAFSEDWRDGGIAPDRWRTFGDPVPIVRSSGGPDGGVFVNNGDAFFTSGAITVPQFRTEKGIAVSVAGRMTFTGRLHQAFTLALYDREFADSSIAAGDASPLVELRIAGPSGTSPLQTTVVTPVRQDVIPAPDGVVSWRQYTLQVQPDGTIEVLVDGRMHWRSSYVLPLRRSPRVRVVLGEQSLDTDVAHGTVRIYEAPRYTIPNVEGLREP